MLAVCGHAEKLLKNKKKTPAIGQIEAPVVTQEKGDDAIHRGAALARIYRLAIRRFRGIKDLSWHPAANVNVILGGGDTGKTTILDAIGLLLSPTNATALSESDYYRRDIDAEFAIEAVLALPPETGINTQTKPAWPWQWNGSEAVIPGGAGDFRGSGEEVYCLRVRGTSDLELIYEIIQPDGNGTNLSVALRRGIGLVRLSGDDRNDRDLRLVQGSALDRLLSDKGLRSRMGSELAKSNVGDRLLDDGKKALAALDESLRKYSLPGGVDLAITGGHGWSVAAMIGLTARLEGSSLDLPLTSWGAGTRRLTALTIAAENQGVAPIILVDEVERGLEPYRQRFLVKRLQVDNSQAFLTTHSPSAISAASESAIWYVDHTGNIARLESKTIEVHQKTDPETFLARLAIVAEGKTECGFVRALLEKVLDSPLEQHGIHVTDGGGHEKTMNLLTTLAEGKLRVGGFVDNEGSHPERWERLSSALGILLFRWPSGCTEENIINPLPDDKLEALLVDPENEKTGIRLRTLADRLGNQQDKDFQAIKATAGSDLKTVILAAALGKVPPDKSTTDKQEKKRYSSHGQNWFKTEEGGRELVRKTFSLGVWPALASQLMPFCNGIRKAVGLPEIENLRP